jgi:outer membrane biosynthesis protein TonB
VKTKIQSLSFLATLAVVFGMISWGSALNAQTTPSTAPSQQTPQTQPAPTPDTPPTQQTPQTQPTPSPDVPPATQQPPSAQSPDSAQTPSSKESTPTAGASGAAASSEGQTFSGTVEKSGDKYVLKDDAGKTYDIDHQDDVKKFEGKRVRVKGTLDASGTKILVK